MGILFAILAMTAIVAVSNVAVQYPLSDWWTWGTLTYPVSFLVTDLTNRTFGAAKTRRVVYVGFAFAVALSYFLATPRIACASGTAFLVAQLCDVYIFDRLRHRAWWQAPLGSSAIAAVFDTALFFSLAFAMTPVPWVTLAIGDVLAKFAMAGIMLIPYGVLRARLRPVVVTGD